MGLTAFFKQLQKSHYFFVKGDRFVCSYIDQYNCSLFSDESVISSIARSIIPVDMRMYVSWIC